MLRSNVPVYFCSIAFVIATPSVANPGKPFEAPDKSSSRVSSVTRLHTKKKEKISFTLPDKQGTKFVHGYIKNNDECLHKVYKRSEGPFAIIDSVLGRYNLPLELKYLAVIESELKTSATSRVGAKGPWQLMPSTGRVLGLKVNHKSDERINYYMSTRAAAKYLRDLHKEFGDWLLVLAAYNGGPKPVYRAIRKAHSRNFWALQWFLPAESRIHVKKFIATALYFEGADSANMAKAARPLQVANQVTTVAVAVKRPSAPIHETADEKFNRLMKESEQSLRGSNELLVNPN